MITEKSCGAIVFTKDNGCIQYVIIRSKEGFYGFPKGHMEENETEKETALREINEEVGLDVQIDEGFRRVETYSPKADFIKDVVYFVAYSKSMDTTMQTIEVREIKWVKLKEALDRIEFPNMQEILNLADDYLDKIDSLPCIED